MNARAGLKQNHAHFCAIMTWSDVSVIGEP